MRFLSRAAVALLIGASAPAASVAPALRPDLRLPARRGRPPFRGRSSRPTSRRRRCPNTSSRRCRRPATTGRPATGPGTTTTIIGCRASGSSRREPGVLWTPGYWAFVGGVYHFHRGYWAPHVGFYGGVNYGFGYDGAGYEGGRWDNGQFFYNATVNNFGAVHVANVYSQPVTVHARSTSPASATTAARAGTPVKPTPEQEQVAAEQHIRPTPAQLSQVRAASVNPEQFQSANQGKPAIAATPRPGEFKGPGVVPAKAAGAAAGHARRRRTRFPPDAERRRRRRTRAARGCERLPTPSQTLRRQKPRRRQPLDKPAKSRSQARSLDRRRRRRRSFRRGTAPGRRRSRRPSKSRKGADKAQKPPGSRRQEAAERREAARRGEAARLVGKPHGADHVRRTATSRQADADRAAAPGAAPSALPKGPPAGAERKPPRPGGKPRLECGRPGLPACPK